MKTTANNSGFTLIEVVIALAIMTLLAALSWRAISTFSQFKDGNDEQISDNYVLQTALSQWQVDLDAATAVIKDQPAIDYNGKALRITRFNRDADAGGFKVVAWMVKNNPGGSYLYRWQSATFHTLRDFEKAWTAAQSWSQLLGDSRGETKILAANNINFYFFLNGSWTNPQSKEALTSKNTLPDGVQMIMELPEQSVFTGSIIKTWHNPTLVN